MQVIILLFSLIKISVKPMKTTRHPETKNRLRIGIDDNTKKQDIAAINSNYVDRRPHASRLLQLQSMANESVQLKRVLKFQQMANGQPIQLSGKGKSTNLEGINETQQTDIGSPRGERATEQEPGREPLEQGQHFDTTNLNVILTNNAKKHIRMWGRYGIRTLGDLKGIVRHEVAKRGRVAGHFDFRLEGTPPGYVTVNVFSNLRAAQLLHVGPYGKNRAGAVDRRIARSGPDSR